MTFDLDTRYTGSAWHYVGQVRRSRSWVKVHGHRMKNVHFWIWMHVKTWRIVLVVCRVLCTEVVGATSSDGFLVRGSTATACACGRETGVSEIGRRLNLSDGRRWIDRMRNRRRQRWLTLADSLPPIFRRQRVAEWLQSYDRSYSSRRIGSLVSSPRITLSRDSSDSQCFITISIAISVVFSRCVFILHTIFHTVK